jgi:hypothetical protein
MVIAAKHASLDMDELNFTVTSWLSGSTTVAPYRTDASQTISVFEFTCVSSLKNSCASHFR